MMKKNFFKNPNFYYYLFVSIAALELIASILILIFANDSRNNAISNIFLSVLAIVTLSFPKYLKDKYHIKFHNWIEILVLVFLFLAIILGFVQDFYVVIRGFDKLVHAISGVVIALVALQGVNIYTSYIENKKAQSIPATFRIFFALTFSISLLVLWEFYEFFVDLVTYHLSVNPTNMQRYQWVSNSSFFPQDYGLQDTMLDLLLGAAGSVVVSITAYIFLRRAEKRQNLKQESIE